ncbi:MAG: TolC family protein [Candidatus Eisenbacteria bacterium]
MRTMGVMRSRAILAALGVLWAGAADAAVLTAEEAVKIALMKNTQIINSQAGVLESRGGVLGAYGALLPTFSGALTREDSRTDGSFGPQLIAGRLLSGPPTDSRANGSSTSLSSSWGILTPSSWADLSSARHSLRASRFELGATRNDVALATRRQFYEVVKAIRLADVAGGALKLARDDERRIRAMFEVGSVSKSDLLKAQVRTAQSEFDEIAARNLVVVQRIGLAGQIGVKESALGEVDTVLTVEPRTYDEATVTAEASRNRPDLMAAEATLKAARAAHSAARLSRLPFVTMGGSATFNSRTFTTVFDTTTARGFDKSVGARIAINWNIFDLRLADAQIAGARARLDRAREAHDALQRNLQGEVHQQLLAYNEAVEQDKVAQRGLESAVENLKLTQEKYKVGSATILELIDAQVQLQTAQSNVVRALAAIRVAEAQIDRVRGHGE